MTRDEAYEIFKKYNDEENFLTRHAYAVEGTMRHFAKLEGEDVEYWGVIGLLHDLDYHMYPQEHCKKTREILEEHGVSGDIIHSIESHAWGMCSDVEPVLKMEKILYTIDELTGLISAASLMRPSKSVMDIEVSSVKKKFKDKRFSAGVDREVIKNGCALCGYELDYVIEQTILGMRDVADAIGLGL